jgi:hypothetical protein
MTLRGNILLVVLVLIALSSVNSLAQCCIQPESETTQTAGTYSTTITKFNQAISDSYGADFDGMTVEEGVAAPGADTCWFNGSAYPKYTTITGGTWTVAGGDVAGQHNHWGYDYVGATTALINYYRVQDPQRGISMPCGFTWYQSMQILCGTIWQVYTPSYGNKLTISIYRTSSVINCRHDMSGSACKTIAY